MLEILRDDRIPISSLFTATYLTGLVHYFSLLQAQFKRGWHQPLWSWINSSEQVQVGAAAHGGIVWPQDCQITRGHMMEFFLLPPKKNYSPCHLTLMIMKENFIIVSTFGTVAAQRAPATSAYSQPDYTSDYWNCEDEIYYCLIGFHFRAA